MRRGLRRVALLLAVCSLAGLTHLESAARAQPPAPEREARPAADSVLLEAEALYAGTGGVYDPAAALPLFEKAAAAGEPLASLRLAILLHLGTRGMPKDRERAAELHRRVAAVVEARAGAGDSYAQYLLGTARLLGLGGAPDLVAARPMLERAATGGQIWAMHNLAWMYEKGRGLPEDAAAAVRWYRRAAEAGCVPSMSDLGRLLLEMQATATACDEGLRWLERAATGGFTASAARLGKVLYFGLDGCVRPAAARARPWLERAAAAQERGAAYDLAFALLVGDAGRADPARAASLLDQAADQQDAIALELLAFLRATGLGAARDPLEARALLERAAGLGSDGFRRWLGEVTRDSRARSVFEQGYLKLEALAAAGDAAAQGLLAQFLYGGYGISGDEARAIALARAAADAGDPGAMRTLAHAYEHGNGVPKDMAQALRLLRRCAELGNSFCMMFYGHELTSGENVARDLETGLAWLLRSAEIGNWWAIRHLGRLYDEGRFGIARDEAKAAYWKRKVAVLGDDEARGWLLYHDLANE